jgi:hypothetical protein
MTEVTSRSTGSRPNSDGLICRLCGGETRDTFTANVLSRYQVSYHTCVQCGSLQSDFPYWLDEAYREGHLAVCDTGAVARTLDSQAIVFAAARVLGLPRSAAVLDFGGGSGLLCRLLRDCGFDARFTDAYASNVFAKGIEDNGIPYDVVCAFEVVEHFSNPDTYLKKIFGVAKSLCIIGTETYTGQGKDWWYIVPITGQHVFFYTERAMSQIAEQNKFRYLRCGNTHIFSRSPLSSLQKFLLPRILSQRHISKVRALLAYKMSYSHAAKDSGLFS